MLRMLNGPHSLLAYCGRRAGHEVVHEAMADTALRDRSSKVMKGEALRTIEAVGGLDLDAYADQLLARFDDPALRKSLAQIAIDATQKIPQRYFGADRQHDILWPGYGELADSPVSGTPVSEENRLPGQSYGSGEA